MNLQKPLDYIRKHWHGDLPLGTAFWVNLIGLCAVIYIIERWLMSSMANQPGRLFVAALVSFIIFRLLIYPWQAVGVFRACERSLREYKNTIWIRCAQGIAVLGIAAVFVDGLNVTRLFFSMRVHERELAHAAVKKESPYKVQLSGNKFAYVSGSLDPGVTREIAELLDQHSGVTTIVFESDGGRVFEARGIAALAKKRALTTYSLNKCYSACAIAFAGGERRILGPDAELGFHRYKLDATYVLPTLDLDKEFQKDLEFLKLQGIDKDFIDKLNDTSSTSMWIPSHENLLQAGVIHEISELKIN